MKYSHSITRKGSFARSTESQTLTAGICSKVSVYLPEKAMAPHSSTLAWKIPWMEEPGGL